MNTIKEGFEQLQNGTDEAYTRTEQSLFYAGAAWLLHIVGKVGEDDSISPEAAVAILSGLRDELKQYALEGMMRRLREQMERGEEERP